MPITEPDPHKILDALHAVLAELRTLDARAGGVLAKVAIGGVDVAIVAVTELARELTA